MNKLLLTIVILSITISAKSQILLWPNGNATTTFGGNEQVMIGAVIRTKKKGKKGLNKLHLPTEAKWYCKIRLMQRRQDIRSAYFILNRSSRFGKRRFL